MDSNKQVSYYDGGHEFGHTWTEHENAFKTSDEIKFSIDWTSKSLNFNASFNGVTNDNYCVKYHQEYLKNLEFKDIVFPWILLQMTKGNCVKLTKYLNLR